MINCKKLTLSDARVMAAAAEAKAVELGIDVCIAVCDDGGHPLWFQRMDRAALISVTMAPAKARVAVVSRHPSKVFQDAIDKGMASLLSSPDLEGMLEGGIPVLADGEVVGAIGVSGAPKGADDSAIARAGAEALPV